jgi:low temperature requirement protein LtrA
MAETMLRERAPGRHARVTNVELFFDLVFVFAVTQLSHTLLDRLTPLGALQTALMMLAVWWAWIYTTWITNWLDPDHPLVRAMLFVLMALGLVLSTSLPDAFDGRALPFALAYVSLQVGRTLFMTWATRRNDSLRRNFLRVACWLGLSAVFWVAGALVEADLRLLLWAVALAIEYVSPAVAFWTPGLGRTNTMEWTVEGAHLAERCGLFIIICLGESVLVTGATFAGAGWSLPAASAFAAALLGSIAMWWIYFSAHADAAAHAIAESRDPGRIARLAYTYAHIPLVAGVIVAAAGDEVALAHPLGHASAAAACLIVGGPALFLAGALWFKFSVFGVVSPSRASGLALLAALALAAPQLTPLALSAAATGVLALVGGWETYARLRPAAATAAAQG